MTAQRLFTVALAIGAAALIPAQASAQILPMTGAQLVDASEHIVVAVVEDATGRWQGRLIHTDYRLRIENRLRGDAPDRITLTLPGGTIGNETHGTSLMPPLGIGERYLLFLGDLDRPGLMPVVGGRQGVFQESAGFDRFDQVVEDVRVFVAGVAGEPRSLDRLAAAALSGGLRPAWEGFLLGDLAVPPIVVNPMPPGSPFSSYDQDQMAYWNVYQPDLFRVTASPSSTWSFGNGVFDIAGFVDDAKLQAEFGNPWFPGGYSLTAWRTRDGHTVEADIALNPAFSWTLDEAAATRQDGPLSFRRAILSDLGTAWGMRVSFSFGPRDRESVVGLAPQTFRFPMLYSDDTRAVRAAFGAAPIRDGLISSYSVLPSPVLPEYVPVRLSPSAVRRGRRFKVTNPVKIENTGTENLVNPAVEVYLVPQRFSMDGAVLLKRVRFRGTVPPEVLRNVNLGSFTVPASTAPGVYFLAFHLQAAGDQVPSNDFAWSNFNVALTVKAK